jgi:hypothetical protein
MVQLTLLVVGGWVAAEHPVRFEADVLHVPGLAAQDVHLLLRLSSSRGAGGPKEGPTPGQALVGVVKSAIRLWTPDTSIADDCRGIEGCRLHRALQGCQPGKGKIRQKPVVICPEVWWRLVLVLEKGPEFVVHRACSRLGALHRKLTLGPQASLAIRPAIFADTPGDSRSGIRRLEQHWECQHASRQLPATFPPPSSSRCSPQDPGSSSRRRCLAAGHPSTDAPWMHPTPTRPPPQRARGTPVTAVQRAQAPLPPPQPPPPQDETADPAANTGHHTPPWS